MALINCPVCGGNISDKAVKCVHCGADLKIEDAVLTNDISKESVTNESIVNGGDVKKRTIEKKKNTKMIIGLTALVCTIAVVIILVFVLKGNTKDSKKDSTDNQVDNQVDNQTEDKNNDLNYAKQAYNDLLLVYSTADSMIGYESSAWKFSIYDTDGIRDLSGGASAFSREVGLDKSKVEKAVNEMAEAIKNNSPAEMQAILSENIIAKDIFENASYDILLVYMVFDNEGVIDDADKLQSEAKDLIKKMDNESKYYDDLKGLYTAVENYWDFAKSPSGSYATLSTNIQNYRSEIDKYVSSLKFDLE